MKDMMVERVALLKDIFQETGRFGGENAVYLFDISRGKLTPPLWKSERVRLSPEAKAEYFERPMVALVDWPITCLGLNSGQVHQITFIEDFHKIETFPSRFLDSSGLRGSVASYVDDVRFRDFSSIRSLVPLERGNCKKIYEASYGGIFELKNDSPEISDMLMPGFGAVALTSASSAVVYDEKLKFVRGPRSMPYDSGDRSKVGDLVDAVTSDMSFAKFTPFDGSGGRQARYHIEGDKVFLAHGNYYDERITVKDMKTKEIVGEPVRILGSLGFASYNGEVFDMRRYRCRNGDYINLVRSVDDQDKNPIIDLRGKRVTSFASTKTKGVVVAVYDQSRNATTFLSHLNQKPFAEFEGRYLLIPSTLGGSH